MIGWSASFCTSPRLFPLGSAIICQIYMIKCLLPFYEGSAQFVNYTQHPNYIPVSFSSYKFKQIFSKHILNFVSNPPPILFTIFAVCTMRLIVWWSLNFVAFGFLFGVITITLMEFFDHSPVSYMMMISCIVRVRSSSPSSTSTFSGTLSPVASLLLIFLIASSSSLCKI